MMKPSTLHIDPHSAGLPKRKGAVSLAYEGGDRSHFEIAAPFLQSQGLHGTFFLPSPPLLEFHREWKAVGEAKHEIGSASLFGVTDDRGNLPNWTLEMVGEDLDMSLQLLSETFLQQRQFPFAYPGDMSGCVSTAFSPVPADYRTIVEQKFRVAVRNIAQLNSTTHQNLLQLNRVSVRGLSLLDIMSLVAEAERERSWLILTFGAIGTGDHGIDMRDHRDVVRQLIDRQDSLHLGPIMKLAQSLFAPAVSAQAVAERENEKV